MTEAARKSGASTPFEPLDTGLLVRTLRRLMAKSDITGKRRLKAHNVSHSNIKTNRWQHVNVQRRRIWVPELKRFVSRNVTTRDIRSIDKLGITVYARRHGIDLGRVCAPRRGSPPLRPKRGCARPRASTRAPRRVHRAARRAPRRTWGARRRGGASHRG